MCRFDGIQRGKCFGGEPVRRTEVEVRMGKFKSRKAAGKDEVSGLMKMVGGDMGVNWIWRLCNMSFEYVVLLED